MEISDMRLKGLKLLTPKVFGDHRGFFFESYQKSVYEKAGIVESFAQDNHSFSRKGCIRGLHFQSFPGQSKLIRVALGKIFDVAVDIRPNSPTYGQWEGVMLDGEKHQQLYIPVGFAHGFCVLSEEAHVMYKVSNPYDPRYETGFRWDDPDVNIAWPVENPIISERDLHSPFLRDLQPSQRDLT